MGRFLLLLAVVCAVTAAPLHAQRRIALVVDTSGSMVQWDPRGYALQIAKILGDLVDDQDRIAIIRFPAGAPDPATAQGIIERLLNRGRPIQDCHTPADPSLALVISAAQRNTFKAQVDQHLTYEGPTLFGSALRTAMDFLGTDRNTPRLLLMLTDAQEGFANCNGTYSAILQRLGGSGGVVSLVKLGGNPADGFANNPAIHFREDVQDSNRLIGAVAQVYQRFLGSNKVQTGRVAGDITVRINAHVKEAFLVVAAESPLGQLQAGPGNPQADAVELDYRDGGETTGLDGQSRGYRIIRLRNPQGGAYTFSTPPGTSGGWMLVEDLALGLRLSQGVVPAGRSAMVQVELFDERTGQRVTDPATLNGLSIAGTVGGEPVSLDASSPGVFSVTQTFDQAGRVPVALRMRSAAVDRSFNLALEAARDVGRLESLTAANADLGNPAPLRVKLTGAAPPHAALVATTASGRVRLNDAGAEGDERAGDGIYSGTWTPDSPGRKNVRFEGEAGSTVVPIDIAIDVRQQVAAVLPMPSAPAPTPTAPPADVPPPARPPPPAALGANEISFGGGEQVDFGTLPADGTASSQARFRHGRVDRAAELEVSTDFNKRRATLEILTPGGWQPLSSTPIRLPVGVGQAFSWPVRVRADSCPEACLPSETQQVAFVARLADGSARTESVPIRIEIVPDAWYFCWRREIIAGLLLLVVGIVAHGIVSPSRFARRAGVQVSPAEDMAEGFFFPFRAARGWRSGFYRDSQLFLTEDFRVSGRRNGGFVRLRADRTTIRMRSEDGRTVWRQQVDGTWEPLPPHGEVIARPGALYRNDSASVYFDVRTK